MRRRCRARTPIWKVRGEVTTTKTFTSLGCRVSRRSPSKCCCYDGAICPNISNLIRIFSPVTGRSWQSVNVSVAFSTSTTKLLISWRTVRIKFEFDAEWICAHSSFCVQSFPSFVCIHLYVLSIYVSFRVRDDEFCDDYISLLWEKILSFTHLLVIVAIFVT